MDLDFEWSGAFTWDIDKDDRNIRKHGLPLRAGIVLFAEDAVVLETLDDRHGEIRFVRMGRSGRRLIVVVWTPDAYDVRLISVRETTKHEREIWQLRVSQ